MLLILNSNIKEKRFKFPEFPYEDKWYEHINDNFLKNSYISPNGIDGVLSILKDTFRVLSLEQTPQ